MNHNHSNLARGGLFLQRGFPIPHLLGDPFARLTMFPRRNSERLKP